MAGSIFYYAAVAGEYAYWNAAAPVSAGTGGLSPKADKVLFLISHGSCFIHNLTLILFLFSFQPPGPDNVLGPPEDDGVVPDTG